MRNAVLVMVLAVAGCGRHAADTPAALDREQIEKNLHAQAEEVGRAALAGDHERMADLTHPEIVRQLGGRAQYVGRLAEIAAEMKGGGFGFETITVARPTALGESAGKWFGIVPSDIAMTGPGGARSRMKSHQLADSVDGGRTWRFVDSSGIGGDRRKLKLVMPDFPADLPLPKDTPPMWSDD